MEDLDGVDAVVHLAGISNDPVGKLPPERIYDPARRYTARLARACRQRGVRFVFASSCSVYGIGGDHLLTEESATRPQTPYSLNKLQIEQDLRALGDERFCPVILRFATVFGVSPRMRFDLFINMFVGMALTTRRILLNSNGQAWRPNVHILDVCKAIRCCLEQPPRANGAVVLNVGETGQNSRILDVAEMVKASLPGCEVVWLDTEPQQQEGAELFRDRKIRDNVDTRTYQVSFERIQQLLPGFRCEWSVSEGVAAMIRELTDRKLTEAHVKRIDFYRLQKLESLAQSGRLSEDLCWTLAPPAWEGARRERAEALGLRPSTMRHGSEGIF
jgi:nucleoside-diphosphate-sugar epimerase